MKKKRAASTTKTYRLLPGVRLSADIKQKVKKIADKYHSDTGKTIVVTSGARPPARQAKAMYRKLEGGDDLSVYRNKKAVAAIKKAYNDAKTAKKSETEIIKAMAEVIEEQVKKGVYISRHLRAGAVDIRSRDMSAKQKQAFRKAAKGIAKSIILETIPPHFHLQF